MKICLQDGKKNLIGGQLKQARLAGKTKITQQDLAARLAVMGIDIDRSAISKIECGMRLVTDYELYALSVALNRSTDWFFEDYKPKD